MSFQVFIQGTSFDVLNSMSFNYVADSFVASGSGSRTYPSLNAKYEAVILNNFGGSDTNDRNYKVTVSGNKVTWDLPNSVRLVVFATPDAGADTHYGGFAYYDYSAGKRTVKLAPDFVPYCLVQVVDIASGNRDVSTPVPSGNGIVAFHRGNNTSASQLDQMIFDYVVVNGKYVLRVTNNPTGGRIYVFSDMLVNVPSRGFYMYREGKMVWHSNCLPLNIKKIPDSGNGKIDSDKPLACPSNICASLKIQTDPQFQVGYDNRQCASAGYVSGRWRVDIADTYFSRFIDNETAFRALKPWVLGGYPAYIETSIYDQYYRAALGV